MPHSARLMPPGLAVVQAGLPALPMVEFVMIGPGGHNPLAEALSAAILQWAASARVR